MNSHQNNNTPETGFSDSVYQHIFNNLDADSKTHNDAVQEPDTADRENSGNNPEIFVAPETGNAVLEGILSRIDKISNDTQYLTSALAIQASAVKNGVVDNSMLGIVREREETNRRIIALLETMYRDEIQSKQRANMNPWQEDLQKLESLMQILQQNKVSPALAGIYQPIINRMFENSGKIPKILKNPGVSEVNFNSAVINDAIARATSKIDSAVARAVSRFETSSLDDRFDMLFDKVEQVADQMDELEGLSEFTSQLEELEHRIDVLNDRIDDLNI